MAMPIGICFSPLAGEAPFQKHNGILYERLESDASQIDQTVERWRRGTRHGPE